MKPIRPFVLIAVAVALLVQVSSDVRAQEEPAPLRVAVLNFETKGEAVGDIGVQVADLLTVFLGMQEGIETVQRQDIKQLLEELALGASGIVAEDKAARIGGMLGAQVLVTGRAFVLNQKLFITGKAISVETSRVNAQLARGPLSAEIDALVEELAVGLGTWIVENRDAMVAQIATPADQVEQLREALGRGELPKIAVKVLEEHVGRATVDPAAETEVYYLLRKVGAPVFEGSQLDLGDWPRLFVVDPQAHMPEAARRADVIIVGEAFSEYAGARENLISVKARVELKAVDTRTREVLAVARQTAVHVDLAEEVAGKTALQRAAGMAAVELIPEAVDLWRQRQAEREGEDR